MDCCTLFVVFVLVGRPLSSAHVVRSDEDDSDDREGGCCVPIGSPYGGEDGDDENGDDEDCDDEDGLPEPEPLIKRRLPRLPGKSSREQVDPGEARAQCCRLGASTCEDTLSTYVCSYATEPRAQHDVIR